MSEITFAQYLKDNSRATHDSVDELVMSVKPFDTPENYIKFLRLQAVFHKIVDDIYKNPELNQKIPHLASLARYDDVMLDLQDVNGQEKPINLDIPKPESKEALGWLYCAEGSNVGAAFLYKDAQNKLGYTAKHGARHLGPHVDGRGKHWREFVEHLNNLGIEGEDREAALRGALNAFAFYKKLVREIFV
ncbi:biliverdin-producing heme oxygenase [Neisseriaceae bacterium B1]